MLGRLQHPLGPWASVLSRWIQPQNPLSETPSSPQARWDVSPPAFFLLTFWWCFPFFAGIFSCSLCCGSPRAGGLAHPGNALPLPDPPSSTTPKLSKGSARLCCLFVVVLLRSCEHPWPSRAGLPWGLHPPGSVQRQPRDCRGGNTNPSRSLPWIQGLRALAGTS